MNSYWPCLYVLNDERVEDLAPRVEHVKEPARIVGHEHRVGGHVDQGQPTWGLVSHKDGCLNT